MEYRIENFWALGGLSFLLIYLGRCFWKRIHLSDCFLWRRTLLNSFALLFCILGLSRPQGGESVTTQVSEQANLFIAMDISQSMGAKDTKPSRMQFAIDFTSRLMDQLTQVKVALYPFTVSGYMMMPLSSDLQAAKDLLGSMSPSIATGQGTDLGTTLLDLLKQIKKSEAVAKARGTTWVTPQILLISDGESHVPVPDSVPLSFRSAQVPIFTVCVGEKTAAPIPLDSRFSGTQFLRDESGRTALTAASPETLAKIAQLSGGSAYRDSFEEIPKLAARLKQSLTIGKLSTNFKLTREFYPICFLIAFLLLFCELLLSRWEFAIRLVWIPLLFGVRLFGSEPMDNEAQAIEFYNSGVQAYEKNDLKTAATELEKSVLTSLDPAVRKRALFNLGNTYLKLGEMEQAVQAYQQSHDTQIPNKDLNKETNQKISDNLALLERIREKIAQKKSQDRRKGEGQGEGNQEGQGQDPKGPQKFNDEGLSEQTKKKVLDHISEEERQILKRLAEERARKSRSQNLKPW